jgi:hypothetical protein
LELVKKFEILFEIILDVNILLMLGLLEESVVNKLFIKLFRSNEYCDGIWPYDPFTIFNAKNCKLLALKGGSNAHI